MCGNEEKHKEIDDSETRRLNNTQSSYETNPIIFSIKGSGAGHCFTP
jgi:hypothetical protein